MKSLLRVFAPALVLSLAAGCASTGSQAPAPSTAAVAATAAPVAAPVTEAPAAVAAPSASATPAAPPLTPAASGLKSPGEAKVGDRTTCPVSKEEFTVEENSPKVEHGGKTYYFCCSGCDKKFAENPAKYLGH